MIILSDHRFDMCTVCFSLKDKSGLKVRIQIKLAALDCNTNQSSGSILTTAMMTQENSLRTGHHCYH